MVTQSRSSSSSVDETHTGVSEATQRFEVNRPNTLVPAVRTPPLPVLVYVKLVFHALDVPWQNVQDKEFLVNTRKKSWSLSRGSVCRCSPGCVSLGRPPARDEPCLRSPHHRLPFPAQSGVQRSRKRTGDSTSPRRGTLLRPQQPRSGGTTHSPRMPAASGAQRSGTPHKADESFVSASESNRQKA